MTSYAPSPGLYLATNPMDTTVAVVSLLFLQLLVTALAAPIALPGCPETCGDITVPYPFGTRDGCFRQGFDLICDETRHPPKLSLGGDHGAEVVGISLPDGTVRIRTRILDTSSLQQLNGTWSAGLRPGGPLALSARHNRFVAMGCNLLANLVAHDTLYSASDRIGVCAALCVSLSALPPPRDASSASCSGVGCCQTPVARGLSSYTIQLNDLAQRPAAAAASPLLVHAVAFIADQRWFRGQQDALKKNFLDDPRKLVDSTVVPTVLEWSLHVDADQDMFLYDPGVSQWKRCISVNSVVVDAVNGNAFDRTRCNCSRGYEGNPYIADGCQDINECLRPKVYPCNGTCINMQGTYGCSAKKNIINLAGPFTLTTIVVGFGLLFSLLGVAQVTKKLKKRRAKKFRQKFFRKNHGLLLQQLISSNKDIAEKMKIFSLQELEQATNKFDHNRILGGGGHGTVYKGILSNQRVVAIKKAKNVMQREIDEFINEVVILSQTNHRNVVKLFGCCLETEVPLLVYEFISNGTLSSYLHGQLENHLSWKDRLRIALETAKAIAYLHSAASISVYHRDIKCANILLTDTLTAKVSDFGASRSITIDETGILTVVQGTYGYLDPEYYYTSRLTEKSDVYSFGVILAELLTGVTPVFSSHSSEATSLASHFVSLMRDNRLLAILDTQIVLEGGVEDVEVVARLAHACLSLKGEERPTMRQVETILEDVQSSNIHHNSQTIRVSQSPLKDQPWKGGNGGEGTRVYSLEKEFIHSLEIPR
ncbi:wall-associated receptor kinase 2-like [Triticum aestivum]|nr:wall-associated receptor kinase 2-like [Triticum aestivum]